MPTCQKYRLLKYLTTLSGRSDPRTPAIIFEWCHQHEARDGRQGRQGRCRYGHVHEGLYLRPDTAVTFIGAQRGVRLLLGKEEPIRRSLFLASVCRCPMCALVWVGPGAGGALVGESTGVLPRSKYYLKYITRHNIEQYKCADNTSMEESVDNGGESILRTLSTR